MSTPDHPAVPHPHRWVILAGLWLIYFSFGLAEYSLAPLVQVITRDLGISHSAMGGVLGAWQLIYVAMAIPGGAVTDRLGPRITLFIATLVIALSAGLRGLAEGQLSLFLSVALFGLGGPLVSIGAPKLVSLWFEGKDRGLAMGIYVSGPALGAVAALSLTNSVLMPLLGGNWRQVTLVYAALALAAGLIWLAISAHSVSRAMDRRVAAAPRGAQLAVFAYILSLRPVRIILVMSVFMFFFSHGLNNWLAEILRHGGMNPSAAGYWASIPMAVGIVSALFIPRLAVPSRRIAILGALIASAGAATFLLRAGDGTLLALALTCQGIARGSMTSIVVLLLMETRGVGSANTGAASGLFFSAAEIGGVLGPLSIGVLYDVTGGFSTALYVLTGVCAVLLYLLSLLRKSVL